MLPLANLLLDCGCGCDSHESVVHLLVAVAVAVFLAVIVLVGLVGLVVALDAAVAVTRIANFVAAPFVTFRLHVVAISVRVVLAVVLA